MLGLGGGEFASTCRGQLAGGPLPDVVHVGARADELDPRHALDDDLDYVQPLHLLHYWCGGNPESLSTSTHLG